MYDLAIELRPEDERCLYQQIYEYIRQEIREGKLLQGERLPSTRSLAQYLQVSRSTAELAYGQLVSEGYLEARPCRGYFVCPIEGLFDLKAEREREPDSAEPVRKRGESFRYDFSPFAIDMSAFPFGVWKRITRETLSQDNSRLFSQGDAQGDWELRATVSRYLHSSRGVNCTPDQILVGAGNDYLLMLLEKLLGSRVRIVMESPTYKRAYQIFQSFGYPITTVEVDRQGMKAGELFRLAGERDGVTAVYVMPSHQYPTGAVMSIGRRMELLKWASQGENRYLIEDDYDSEFRYRGKPIPSLQGADKGGKVIYIGTFSKAIAPAIRVSYMVLPLSLLRRLREECYFYSSTVSRIDQRILDEFIRGGYFERHLNKMRKLYRGKHDLLLESLGPFRDDFEISGENAGLHLLLADRRGRSQQELLTLAKERGVRVYGMSDNVVAREPQKRGPATVILGYGGLREEEIAAGVERLKKAWL